MIALVDYGVGNLFSLACSFKKIGENSLVTGDPEQIRASDGIVLPGVGAFRDAAEKLRASGLDTVLMDEVRKGKKLLGICLGMQLLFEKSLENGEYEGLGLMEGTVRPLAERADPQLKIPQIGWNALHITGQSPLLRNTNEGDFAYFVHSYYADTPAENVIAVTDYSFPVTAAVARGCVYGCQFHPEKSGDVGLKILKAFCEVKS